MSKLLSSGEIGAKIKAFRLQAGFTQERLAEELDITFQQVQKYERGVTKVNLERLQQLAEVLRVPVASFFDGESSCTAYRLSEEEIGLVKAFRDIKVPRHKESVVDIVNGLSKRRG